METVRPVLAERRDEIFLLSKVVARDRKGADDILRESLKRMSVDSMDIVLLHSVGGVEAIDSALGAGGAIEALEAARDAGVIRYIGISGHYDSKVLAHALDRYDFDLVLAPVNPMDSLIDDFVATLSPYMASRNVALMGMKVFASNRAPDPDAALRYALSQPFHTYTLGMKTIEQVDFDVELATAMSGPLSADELASIVDDHRTLAKPGNFYWRNTSEGLT